jgi:hypothetical protein
LPPIVVSAITELFQEGVADPRGCTYREIEISYGEGTIKTGGWVFPENGGTPFAVGWDGLVHALKSVGAPLDLRQDFAARNHGDDFQGLDDHWPAMESWSVDTASVLPLKAAFLLRLGYVDLAEDLWRRGFAHHVEMAANDPYVLMANPWLAALYDRAVMAHLNGDDSTALAACRLLVPLQKIAEARAAARNIPKPAKDDLYFTVLAHLPELAADQERRATEAPYTTAWNRDCPPPGDRIAALIRDLEQVSVIQMMNPGQTDTYDDPIVQELIQEGDAAVEPLIDCWENDPRLTRSRFTAGMMRGDNSMIHVYEAAYIALDCVLDKPFYFSDADDRGVFESGPVGDPRDQHARELTLDDRLFLGEKMRAYWNRYKGMTLPERWLSILHDDLAGSKAWIKAIEWVTAPAGQVEVSFGIYGGSMGWGYPTHPGAMKGDSLRSQTDPSVSDLIIERFRQLENDPDPAVVGHLGNLILGLADWDGKAHLPEIREFAQALAKRPPQPTLGLVSPFDMENLIYQRRLMLGDSTALSEYAGWLQTVTPQKVGQGDGAARFFQIMWHHPNDPVIRDAAAKLFTSRDSPWIPLPNDLVHTPLIGLPEFRQELLRGLDDTSAARRVRVESAFIAYNFERTGGSSTSSPGLPDHTPFAPKPGTTITIRICDCYASQLAGGWLPRFSALLAGIETRRHYCQVPPVSPPVRRRLPRAARRFLC